MVFFSVTENINIKTTDGSLVKYTKLRNPENTLNHSIYVSTYEEVERLNSVFEKVGPNFQSRIHLEKRLSSNKTFPIELGISNKYEYNSMKQFQYKIDNNDFLKLNYKDEAHSLVLNEEPIKLYEQLSQCKKKEIKVAIIGNVGEFIGEMVAALSAIRILKEYLSKKFKRVQLDLYLEAAENQFYTRDKEILSTQEYIDNIKPLALDFKSFCEYDFYIDNSLVRNRSFYQTMPYVDAYLHKFGIDYKKIPASSKHNHIDATKLKVYPRLKEQLEKLKLSGQKLLLFHPFTSHASRSFPKEIASELLTKLQKKAPGYQIVTALKFDTSKHDGVIDLSGDSKTIYDFIYIISQMDAIISADTSTYHIADAFFIPTVVVFTDQDPTQRVKYYSQTKVIQVKDESKNFSYFKFDADSLVLHKFESWKKLKVSKIIKLLESF